MSWMLDPGGGEPNPDLVSQAEAEAGTAVFERIWSALRVAQAIAAQAGSGGGISWAGKTADYELTDGDFILMVATSGTPDLTFGTIAADEYFVAHNASTSSVVVSVVPGSLTIKGAADTITTPDTLILAPGETISLVALSSSVLEIV